MIPEGDAMYVLDVLFRQNIAVIVWARRLYERRKEFGGRQHNLPGWGGPFLAGGRIPN